ncbi:hypothetical protein [Cellulosimicrobium sp. 22601]|uniref:hypothetical protein n=1 Tax=unclassified Cellulosimicrobium TaxID=2624466 RepID=UPI003F8787F5
MVEEVGGLARSSEPGANTELLHAMRSWKGTAEVLADGMKPGTEAAIGKLVEWGNGDR